MTGTLKNWTSVTVNVVDGVDAWFGGHFLGVNPPIPNVGEELICDLQNGRGKDLGRSNLRVDRRAFDYSYFYEAVPGHPRKRQAQTVPGTSLRYSNASVTLWCTRITSDDEVPAEPDSETSP